MGFTDDHILIDYFDSRIIGFRILIHHRSIGRVALSTIASIILSHHHDVLILFREVAEGERRLAVEVRSGLERRQGMALSDLGIFAEQFDTRRNSCMP